MTTLRAMMAVALLVGGVGAAGCCSGEPKSAEPDTSGYGQLTALADKYGSDKGSEYHNFTDLYELFFLPMRDSATKIFEIGILEGASMKMLRDFFPNATIYGADIYDKSDLDSDRLKTLVADQSKRAELRKLIDEHGSDYDIIIDDGGHTMEQQQVSFGFLFPHVKPGGYYIIEDVQTSLMGPQWGALEHKRNTTLGMYFAYVMTDRISSTYMKDSEMAYASTHIDSSSLHVHDGLTQSIAWIIKKKAAPPA